MENLLLRRDRILPILIAVTLALLASGIALSSGRGKARPTVAVGGEVHGTIYALIRGRENTGKGALGPYIFVPDIFVYLQNVSTSAHSTEVQTDLDGAFMIPSQPEAQYQACWHAAGYASGCGAPFILRSANINLEPLAAIAEPGAIYGRAALKDGAACRFLVPFLGANVWTQVSAAPASGPAKTVRANNFGEYVLSGLPAGTAKLVATCEGAHTSVTSSVSGGAVLANLTLPNSRPTAYSYASLGGQTIGSVATGNTVQAIVNAKATGGFPLHYRWATDPSSPGFTSQDVPNVNWPVVGRGLASIYVWAGDGMGGNVLSRVTLSTTPNNIPFSGIVTANDAPVVPGAEVVINGVTTGTTPQGGFSLALPKEEGRYVVTITKPGYQMLSRVLYSPVVGATFKLYRAQDFLVDPTKPISVTEKPSKTSERAGVQIQIPANALAAGLTGKGALAAGPLHIRALTYNLHDPEDQLPGDYGGIDKEGRANRLATFGAANIDIQDAAGHPFNLAPGKSATIHVPIDSAQAAGAPPTMRVWHYNSAEGMWREDGKATRVGSVYQAKVTHFSAVNMDLGFNGNAACTRIVVDTGIMPTPFKIRMTPKSGNFTVDANHQNQVIDGPLNVVVREPSGISVQFDMVDSAGNIIPGASQTITTGAASPSGALWDPPPNPPYGDCTSEVDYNEQTVKGLFPAGTGSSQSGFLTFRTPPAYLDNTQAPALTTAYYAKIDPGGTKTAAGDVNDFAHWKTINGFDRGQQARVIYENEYDLGFGRDMHMQIGGQDGLCANCIAYYVTNYANVEDAVTAQNSGVNQKATVAMEFSPQNGSSGTPYTKFYVFNPDGPGSTPGSIANSVALDDFGPKAVPTLCIICHIGNINSMGPDGSLPFARFIPFDLQSFRYHPSDPAWQRPAQESNFKILNAGLMNHTNVSAPLKALITNWYGTEGDLTLPNPTFADNRVPSLWTSPTNESPLYQTVVQPSCRSCHTTRDSADIGQDISWQSYDSLNSDSFFARSLACNPSSHLMPQAERTFARFWLSTQPNQPIFLAGSSLSAFQSPNNSCQ